MIIRLLILFIILLFSPDLKAQNAFSSSAAGIEVSVNTADTKVNSYWQQNPALTLFWAMPFYFGEIEFQAGYLPFRAVSPDIPDINNILTTLNWGLPLNIRHSLSIAGGGFIGSNFMYQSSKGPLHRPESEFTAGLFAQINYRITDSVSFRGSLRQTRVYTYHRLNLTYLGFGIQYHFDNPQWLKEFFQ